MKEIIFDLDGTLWNPTEVVIKSWNEILGKYSEVKRMITEEDLKSVLGLQIPHIGEKLFPYLEKELSYKIMNECCEYENSVILQQGGLLYEGMENTIKILFEKYPLFIISNCNKGYIEAFLEYHNLGKYFVGIECFGNTGLTKGENIKKVVERYKLVDPIYVGDTQSDCDACMVAKVPFVFAGYGFGKANCYDYYLNQISDLLEIDTKL